MTEETLATIRVPGLNRLEKLSLNQPGSSGISFDEERLRGGTHGELVTTAVVLATLGGIKLLAAWLSKDRDVRHFRKEVTITFPDGKTRTEVIEIDLNKSTSKADVIKQLGSLTDIDVSSLLDEKGADA